jgi:protein-S-isoprenylcysteine O-methyltransferase Ste14
MPDSRLTDIIYKWRVRSGLLFALVALVFARPGFYSLLASFGMALLGLSLRTWACGHLEKERELTKSGPYQYTRNPLYLGNLILGFAIVVASLSWWVLVFFFVYFLLFYPVLVRVEKERMSELYPESYREYSAKVPLFFPSLRTGTVPGNTRFHWDRYQKNKEYRALIGTLLYWTALAAKAVIF